MRFTRPLNNSIPPAVQNLIIINVIVFFACTMLTKYNLQDTLALHYWGATQPDGSSLFKPWQLITHLFVHGSFQHLLFNMIGLFMFGSILENYTDAKRFMQFYIIAGILASLLQLAYVHYNQTVLTQAIAEYSNNANVATYKKLLSSYFKLDNYKVNTKYLHSLLADWENDPSNAALLAKSIDLLKNDYLPFLNNYSLIGASGAVSALLAASVYLFPNMEIVIDLFIPLKIKYAALLYLCYDAYKFIAPQPGENVAHLAHIGGLVFGYIIILIYNKVNKKNFY
jgi:membrane associated rhomboid family serine protease